MKTLLAPLVFLSVVSAHATDAGTRGGGNAVICFNDPAIPVVIRKDKGDIKNEYISKITSIEMLDLYEVKLAQGMDSTTTVEIKDVLANEGLSQFTKRMLGRIRPFTPKFYDKAMEMMAEMPPERAFAHPYGIENVNDFNLMGRIDSRNCVVGTVLAHTPNGQITDIHYDQRLWNHASFGNLNKHVAYLHEVVYRTYREMEDLDANSDQSRRIVGMLLKKDLKQDELTQKMGSILNISARTPKDLIETYQCYNNLREECMLNFGSDLTQFYRYSIIPVEMQDAPRILSFADFMSETAAQDPAYKKYQELRQRYYDVDAMKRLSPVERQRVQFLLSEKDMLEPYIQDLTKKHQLIYALHRKNLDSLVKNLKKDGYYSAQQIESFSNQVNTALDILNAEHRKAAIDLVNAAKDRRFDNSSVTFGALKLDFSGLYKMKGQL
jgi:hypothetical protein